MEEDIFSNFNELKGVINRCAGRTKSGKKCRTRLKENVYLYCCESHKPYNSEILKDGCFCCSEKLINHKDVIHFKCNHLVHKLCYDYWCKNSSTYETPICLLCKTEINKHLNKKNVIEDYVSDENIYEIVNLIDSHLNDENNTNFNDLFNYNNSSNFDI